ncbi:MAG: hypothetical protein LBQ18_04955 [Campylobacteraceae bacterium]|jgi:hypothetical protein|nr:hypothetical protein [Campylobacteraceae bacterium]
MVNLGGDNIFENNEFRCYRWAVDILQAPQEVYEAFSKLGLLGKKIASIKSVGHGYSIGDYSYGDLSGCYDEEPLDEDENTPCPMAVEIDEPMIIVFEDGERFEIDYSEASSVMMAKNTLPIDIKAGINFRNFDASKLFSPCIGQTIIGIKVTPSEYYPYDFTGSYGMAIDYNQEAYIKKMDIYLDGNMKLSFSSWYDYGYMCLTDMDDNKLQTTFGELKAALILE